MSTSVVCPKCGQAATYFRPPVAGCRHCQAPYPDALRRSAEQALISEAPQRPWLLQFVLLGTGVFGVLAPLLLTLAPFDLGSYTIDQEKVSGPEFIKRAGFLFATAAACSLAIAYGIWRERPWAREVMLGSWFLAMIAGAGNLVAKTGFKSEALIALLQALLMTAAVAWYLYRKPNVVGYFETLKHLSERRESGIRLSRGGGA